MRGLKLLLLGAALIGMNVTPGNAQKIKVGEPAPDFTVPSLTARPPTGSAISVAIACSSLIGPRGEGAASNCRSGRNSTKNTSTRISKSSRFPWIPRERKWHGALPRRRA